MGWGSLSSAHQVLVTLAMKGGPAYAAQARRAAASTNALGAAVLRTSANMHTASKRTWLYNQSLYTARRYAFYATLATTALIAEVARLGFSYLSTMQTASVALRPAFSSTKALNVEMDKLYRLAALSPFLFGETVTAFRSLYPAFKSAGISVAMTNNTLRASMDGLSEAGRLTNASLNRVSVQYQHMVNIGKPTGQTLNALAKDGLPVYQALKKELHLTGNSLADMAHSGISAVQVIKAINRYIETSPLYKGAGMRQANLTLSGSWAQFKDILSQAAGRGEAGMFGGLQKALTSVNYSLAPLLRAGKPITLYNIASAIDHAVTPSTHLVINLFSFFQSALKSAIVTLGVFAITLSVILRPFDYLGSLFGANTFGAHLFGTAIGVLIGVFAVYKTAVVLATIWTGVFETATLGAEAVAKIYTGVMKAVTFATEAYTVATKGASTATWIMGSRGLQRNAALGRTSTRVGLMLRNAYFTLIPVVQAATVAMTRFAISLLLNPWTYIIIALVILYFKVKAFRDVVNSLWRNMIYFSPLIAAALTVAFGPLGVALTAIMLIIRYHKQLANLTRGTNFNALGISSTRPATDSKHKHQNLWHRFWGGEFAHLPFAASGGTVMSAGHVMVGERGPEILRLPRGAQVQPLSSRTLNGAGELSIYVYPQAIHLDGKQIGSAMATAVTDKKARQ